MRIIAQHTLHRFGQKHEMGEFGRGWRAWYAEAREAMWRRPMDIKNWYNPVEFVGKDRAVFELEGGRFRLLVQIKYGFGIVFVRFAGTAQQFSVINAEEV